VEWLILREGASTYLVNPMVVYKGSEQSRENLKTAIVNGDIVLKQPKKAMENIYSKIRLQKGVLSK
jgi:hypothetical protein